MHNSKNNVHFSIKLIIIAMFARVGQATAYLLLKYRYRVDVATFNHYCIGVVSKVKCLSGSITSWASRCVVGCGLLAGNARVSSCCSQVERKVGTCSAATDVWWRRRLLCSRTSAVNWTDRKLRCWHRVTGGWAWLLSFDYLYSLYRRRFLTNPKSSA